MGQGFFLHVFTKKEAINVAMSLELKANIMDQRAMERALRRVAHEIIENNRGVEGLKLVGIQRRGVMLARILRDMIKEVEGVELPMGVLDITFYRDDLSLLQEHPVVNATDLPFQVQDAKIIMVDDVLYTGRTARAVRPEKITSSTMMILASCTWKGRSVALTTGCS